MSKPLTFQAWHEGRSLIAANGRFTRSRLTWFMVLLILILGLSGYTPCPKCKNGISIHLRLEFRLYKIQYGIGARWVTTNLGVFAIGVCYNACRDRMCSIRKANFLCTQEERLTALEEAQAKFGEAVNDLNHHVTMLIGVASREEWDIREMKSSLRAIDGRLGSLEGHLGSLDGRLGSLEGHLGSLDGRLGSLEGHLGSLDGRLGSLEGRFEVQDKKLDQVLLLLNTLAPKPEQET